MSRRGPGNPRRSVPAFLVLVPLLGVSFPSPQGDPEADRIALYRKYLLGPDPEPARSKKRALAILSLVRSDVPRAHEVLRRVLEAVGDPKLAPPGTIRRIVQALQEQASVDLAPARILRLQEDPDTGRRLKLYVAYIPAFLRLFTKLEGKEAAPPGATGGGTPQPGGKKPLLDPAELRDVRAALRGFLSVLPREEKRRVFPGLFKDEDPKVVRAAILLAGETEDPQMAGLLAPMLEDQTLRGPVQEAMGRLTLRLEPFRDPADFEAWWKRNGGKTWEQLAREAALDRQRAAARMRAAQRKRLESLARRMIRMGLALPAPPWEEFRDLLDDPELEEDRLGIVEQMTRGLTAREPGKPDGEAQQAFLKRVLEGYQRGEGGVRLPWLALYTAAARIAGGDALELARNELLRRVASRGGKDRARLYALLRFFPVDEVRSALLSALETDLEALDLGGFESGLESLKELRPPKDPNLGARLRDFLVRCIQNRKLPLKLREQALDNLGRLDRHQGTEALRRLFALGREGLEESLRLRSLGWIQTLVASHMQASAGKELKAQAEAQLGFLLQALADPSPNVRRQVARILAGFPPAKKNFSATEQREFALSILGRLGEALAAERDPGCLEDFRAVILAQARDTEVAGAALERLVLAFRSWAAIREPGKRPDLAAMAAALAKDFSVLLRGKGLEPAHLLELAGILVEAGRSGLARLCLEAPPASGLEAEDPKLPAAERERRAELRKRRASLVLSAAGPLEGLEDGKDGEARARFLLGASRGLADLGSERPEARAALGLANFRLGKAEEAVRALEPLLRSSKTGIPPALEVRVRSALARAYLDSGRPAEAAKVLEGRTDQASRLLRLRALASAAQWGPLEEGARELLKDPGLPKSGPLREGLLLDLARALLGQGKLEETERTLGSMPLLENEGSKQRYEILRRSLDRAKKEKAAREAREAAARASKKEKGAGKAKPGGASGTKKGGAGTKGSKPSGSRAGGGKAGGGG